MEKAKPGTIRPLINSLIEIKKTERLWHIPLLTSLSAGIPLFAGLYFNQMSYGILASIAGLVILYLPVTNLANRMITMLACSFGFLFSFTVGFIFSFHPVVSVVALGLFGFSVQWVANYFRMKPPGSFFFLMIASVAISMPFNLSTIAVRIGVVGMATMLACVLAFLYSLYIVRKYPPKIIAPPPVRRHFANAIESMIIGIFLSLSLLIGHLLGLKNPYWIPISCLAVMQGVSLEHIWSRGVQRILGTLVGLGLTWILLLQQLTPLTICISVFILQFIVEMLVVRHYGLAVIFITPLTLLLAEASSAMTADPNVLMKARILDIALGSAIGAIAGWFIHHEQLKTKAERQLRKTRIAVLRK